MSDFIVGRANWTYLEATWPNSLAVYCRFCAARPGEKCFAIREVSDRKRSFPHSTRMNAWHRAGRPAYDDSPDPESEAWDA